MFKSITYLRCEYDKVSNKYIYYHLVDSEFECDVSVASSASEGYEESVLMRSVIVEYHKRNLPLIKNLYLLNNYLLKDWYPDCYFEELEELLDYQKQYIDKYYPIPGINFSKDIYPKLLKMHEELSVFK